MALMQGIFWWHGAGRDFPYREVQAFAVGASVLAIFGVVGGRPVLFAWGLGLNAFLRLLQPVLGITRLPLWLNVLMIVGWLVACVRVARREDAQVGLWVLGAAHVFAMLWVLSALVPAVALLLGAVGFLVAAPHVRGRAA